MTQARDSQRARLYRAEDRTPFLHRQEMTLAEVRAYVDRIVGEYAVPMRVTIKDGRGRRSGAAVWHAPGSGTILLPKFARTRHYVRHEMAHLYTRTLYGTRGDGVVGHGHEFAGLLVEITDAVEGATAADALVDSFEEHRVRWTLPDRSLYERLAG